MINGKNLWVDYMFTGGEPQHHCKLSDSESLNDSIPLLAKGKKFRYSQCTRYINSSLGNSTMPCSSGWEYDSSEFESTIVTEARFLRPLKNLVLIKNTKNTKSTATTFCHRISIQLNSNDHCYCPPLSNVPWGRAECDINMIGLNYISGAKFSKAHKL